MPCAFIVLIFEGSDTRRRLQVRAVSQQTALAIFHHELARVPWHVGNFPSEFYALRGVLGIKCVGFFDEHVRVEQFVPVFVRIGCGRLGAAEVNHLLVARHDCIDRRIMTRPSKLSLEFVRSAWACAKGDRGARWCEGNFATAIAWIALRCFPSAARWAILSRRGIPGQPGSHFASCLSKDMFLSLLSLLPPESRFIRVNRFPRSSRSRRRLQIDGRFKLNMRGLMHKTYAAIIICAVLSAGLASAQNAGQQAAPPAGACPPSACPPVPSCPPPPAPNIHDGTKAALACEWLTANGVLPTLRALEDYAVGDGIPDAPTAAARALCDNSIPLEDRAMVDAAFRTLSVLERRVIVGTYVLRLSNLQLGRTLGLSPRCITRVRRGALGRMQTAWAS